MKFVLLLCVRLLRLWVSLDVHAASLLFFVVVVMEKIMTHSLVEVSMDSHEFR